MQLDRDRLRSYVAGPVARRFVADERPLLAPEVEVMHAALLMADIAGFTQLTTRLSNDHAAGPEILTSIINEYFAKLMSVVSAHGGEVVELAGDALVAMWTAGGEEHLAEAVLAAASCGITIQRHFHDYRAAVGVQLSLRVGLGAGQLFGVHVGGVGDKWFYILTGEAMLQTVAAVVAGAAGEVLISSEAARIAGSSLQGTAAGDGMVRVRTVASVRPRPPVPQVSIHEAAWQALEQYVPDQVLHGVAAGQGDWLGESRHVSVMFVKLHDISPSGSDALETAQAAMVCTQQVFRQFDGFINQIIVDDKGAVIVGVFGAPPQAHEDDALRSVHAAIELQRALAGVGQRCGIGVTTGRAFVGPTGGELRRAYSVMGEVINLAARFMVAAGEGILCDRATVTAVSGRAEFEAPIAVDAKGWSEQLAGFAPVSVDRRRGRRFAGGGRLVGRDHELATIERCLDAVEAGESRVLVLQGEPGVGKSRLVLHLVERAGERGLRTMVAEADAMQQSTPYFAWRQCLISLLGLELAADWTSDECRERVLRGLSADDRASDLVPLLSSVLPVEFADTEVTREMAGEDRAYSTRQLISRMILEQRQRSVPAGTHQTGTVLILEDTHWFDSASWDVAGEVSATLAPLLTVIATRPVDASATGILRVTEGRSVETLSIEALSPADTGEMIRDRLDVDAIPEALTALVALRAEGNPFFSQELVLALRDAGIIEIVDGTCRFADENVDLRSMAFPDTLHGVVTSRIDRLPTTEQLTIKVAAVVGRVFGYTMLSNVHPTVRRSEALRAELEDLRRLDLTPLHSADPDLAYFFKHVITQEVAYSLLPTMQRSQLHRAAAEWIEMTQGFEVARASRDLAHHWSHAGDAERAMVYHGLAGRDALRLGAYREAAESFEQALQLAAGIEHGPGIETLVDWQIRLGEAYDGLSDFDHSAEHFELALALRGRPLPNSTVAWVALLVKQVSGQMLTLALPGRRIGRVAANDADLEVGEVYRRVALVYYHRNQKLQTVSTVILGLNTAERCDSKKHRAEFSGNAAVTCNLIGIHPLGRRYLAVATQSLAELDDPTTATWVKQVTAWYRCGAGAMWQQAQTEIDEALEIAHAMGLRRQYDEQLLVRAVSRWPEPFAVRAELFAVALQSGAERGDGEVQIWARSLGAATVLPMGKHDDAIRLIEPAIVLFRPGSSRTGYVKAYGTLSLAYHRAGRRDEAVAAVQRALQAVQEASPILVSMFDGYANTVETCLALWTDGDGSWAASTKSALKCLRSLGKPFKVARPRAQLYAGRIRLQKGHRRRAERRLRRALELALAMEMPYEVALAKAELGPLLLARGKLADGDRHLAEARTIFGHLGAQYDLDRLCNEIMAVTRE